MEWNRSEVNLSMLSSLWLLLKSPITVYKAAYLCRGTLFSLFIGNNHFDIWILDICWHRFGRKFEMKAWWWTNKETHPDITDPRSCWSNASTLKWFKIYSKPASLSENIPCIPICLILLHWVVIKKLLLCSYFVSSFRLCSLMLTMTQYIKEEGSCKRTKFALMLTFLPDKFYYHLSVKDYTGLNLQWCPLFKWMLTTFHTFGTICLRKHIFWMSIASDWSLKDRIPIFVLHIKIKLHDIHF